MSCPGRAVHPCVRSGQSLPHVNELAEFVVGVLGRIGDRDTVEVLKRVIDDAALGECTL